jgi:putative FmdB family regulatory protein
MPTYGYHCGRCGHEFEVRQSMSDAPLKDCPECGGELRKLLYPVGVQFKGSGFYTTDYRSGGDKSKAASESSETKSEGAGSSSSSNGSEGGGTQAGSSDSSEKKKKKKTDPAASKE